MLLMQVVFILIFTCGDGIKINRMMSSLRNALLDGLGNVLIDVVE